MRWRAVVVVLGLAACAPKVWHDGTASWYGPGFAGRPTASGEVFHPAGRTAAHRTLPFGTVLRVERADGTRVVKVVVNDRGPFVAGRELDLSKGAARQLDMIAEGVTDVRWRVVGCRHRFDGPKACDAVP